MDKRKKSSFKNKLRSSNSSSAKNPETSSSNISNVQQSMGNLSFRPNVYSTTADNNYTDSDSVEDDIDKILRSRNLEKSRSSSKSRLSQSLSSSASRSTFSAHKSSDKQRRSTSNPTKKTIYGNETVGVSGYGRQIQDARPGPSKNLPKSTNKKRKQTKPKKQLKHFEMEIQKYQQSTMMLVPKLPFSRVIRELLMKYAHPNDKLRVTPEALNALQEASELYLVQLFADSYLCTLHRNRVTLVPRDLNLVLGLRKH